MKRTALVLLILIYSFSRSFAQIAPQPLNPSLSPVYQTNIPSAPVPLTLEMIKAKLKNIDSVNVAYIINQYPISGKLRRASQYTFRNLVKNDFSTVTIADNSATVGQFAALSIDPNSYKLAFSPYAWSPQGKDLAEHDFKNVYAFNVTTTLSNQSLLDLKDWRTVSGSFSFTHLLWDGYRFSDVNTPKSSKHITQDEYIAPYKQIYSEIGMRMIEQFDDAFNGDNQTIRHRLGALNHPEFADIDGVKQAYLDSVSKYEQLYTNQTWTMKSFWWYKITATPLSFDNANYVVNGDQSTYDSPKKATIYTWSVNLALNYFEGFSNHWNFYFNVNAQISQKDMFSGIYTPATYNGFSKLTDTSLIQKTNEQIFRSPSEDISKRILPDFGGEIIMLKSLTNIAIGADFVYAYNFVISDESAYKNGYISSPSVGLILGFKDKTGKSNINIEPYFQFQNFIHVSVRSQHLFGLKFSIPINSLY